VGVLSLKRENFVAFLPFYLLVIILFIGVAVGGSRAVTTITENQPVPRNITFIIDAGHGGIDGGATSCTGALESRLNLEISLRLNDLMQLLGYRTVMIRTTDTSVHTSDGSIAQIKLSDLKERVRIVNETENGILISIHQNTFSDSRYSGPQVFYGRTGEGEELAKILQLSLNDSLKPDGNRQSKKAEGIYLMDHIRSTGVLIECGFLSNPAEEMKLRSDTYQQKLCCVIGTTVGNFLDG
jgi:N-acetylmuramoyl-L-alanine amidase